ncbi:MAG: hypothetical protein PHR53_01190 [Bacteroidales bacterium]|nr:hypothetical protein [Bacteroidales bacterium]
MIKRLLFFMFLLLPISLFAGNEWQPSGARQAGLGGASVGIVDLWSATNNQAGMAFFHRPAAGIYFSNRYMVKELSTKSLTATMPLWKNDAIGVSVNHFGYSAYYELTAGVSYARKFGNRFAASLQFDYLRLGQGMDFGSKDAVTFEASIMAFVAKNMTLGIHVFNPIGIKFKDDVAAIPACYRIGLAWNVAKRVLVAAEVEKRDQTPINVKLGAEYSPVEWVSLRAGFSLKPAIFDIGFGFNIKNFVIDLTPVWDPTLGWSTHIALSYTFGKKQ